MNNKDRKPKKSPGNERRSERGGQPPGPRRIRAQLTLVGAPARIRKGDPLADTGGPSWADSMVNQQSGIPTSGSTKDDRSGDGAGWSPGHRSGPTTDGPTDTGLPKDGWERAAGWRHSVGFRRELWDSDTKSPETCTTALSPLAESFKPRTTSEVQQLRSSYTDNGLDRSLARTGSSKVETNWNNTERRSATIGKAGPIETKEPVAMADVAEPPGPVGVRAGGPVVAGTQFRAVTDRTGASGLNRNATGEPVMAEMRIKADIAVAEAGGPAGTGAGSPVMVGNRLLAVADVHAWLENREDDPQSDLGKFEPVTGTITEVTRPQPLRHADARKEVVLKKESDSVTQHTDSEAVGEASDGDQVGIHFLHRSSCGENSLWDVNGGEDTAEGDAIMVGSAALWFLTGWTNDVEVEFMIDTGCQVTILVTSVFERSPPPTENRVGPLFGVGRLFPVVGSGAN